jgi:hypothetical protein
VNWLLVINNIRHSILPKPLVDAVILTDSKTEGYGDTDKAICLLVEAFRAGRDFEKGLNK